LEIALNLRSNQLCMRIRKREIFSIKELLKQNSDKNLLLIGSEGCGKSTLLRLLADDLNSSCISLTDFTNPVCRSRLGLAVSCADRGILSNDFQKHASIARKKGTIDSISDALNDFVTDLKNLPNHEYYILLDTVTESICTQIHWLVDILNGIPNIKIIAASNEDDLPLPSSFLRYKLDRIDEEGVKILSSILPQEHDSLSFYNYLEKESGGNGVLLSLLLWAVERNGAVCEFSLEKEKFIKKVIDQFSEKEREVWMVCSLAKKRVSAEIIRLMLDVESVSIFNSYVVNAPFLSVVNGVVSGYRLHDVASKVLLNVLDITLEKKRSLYEKLEKDIYPILMMKCESSDAWAELHLEQLSYSLMYDQYRGVKELYVKFLENSISGNMYVADSLVRLLDSINSVEREPAPLLRSLLQAEREIIFHETDKAFNIINNITKLRIDLESEDVRVRYCLVKAKCATGPSPVKSLPIFDIITELEAFYSMSNKLEDELEFEVGIELAKSLQIVGQNDKALKVYRNIRQLDVKTLNKVRSFEEESNLLRLMQNLDESEKIIGQGFGLRVGEQIEADGVSIYYLANIERDRDHFGEASDLYTRAEGLLIDSGQIYHRCALYGDAAWMYYLDGNTQKFEEYLEKYYHIASSYNFMREISEYWHMKYHSKIDEGDKSIALSFLDRALEHSFQYGNVYMQLDCLMHKVQHSVEENDLISSVDELKKMEELEEKGAGIRVFRGRAIIYLGDLYYKRNVFAKCFYNWKVGFELVAEFGNSRTNVELLTDYVEDRKEKLHEVMTACNMSPWPTEDVFDKLPALKAAFNG